MRSKDLIQQELKGNLSAAFKSENPDDITRAFTDFAESVQQSVLEECSIYHNKPSALKANEEKFYQSIIGAMQSSNPRQAFDGLDNALPESIIDKVIEDIKTAHPLLDAINFTNTNALTKIIVNKQGIQLATWDALNSEITKELSGAIGRIDLNLCKLSSYIPISKDMLALGPVWIDAYVRNILAESIALALETAIIDGTGNKEPVGMNRSVADDAAVTGGVYPKKEKVVVTKLDPVSYGTILSKLSDAPNGRTRVFDNIIFVVNPKDYYTKIMPSSIKLIPDGTYKNNIFPFPTTVIQSSGMPVGEAVFGLADKYFMGIGAGTNGGKIEYSDEYKFLEDERVYLTKLYGNGRALDDNAFILADISTLQPLVQEISIDGVVKTKEQTV